MVALLTASVRIRGERETLFNRFSPSMLSLEKSERHGVKGNDPEEWRYTFTCTEEGRLYVQPAVIFACLRDAAKYTRHGRSSLQPMLAATLQVTSKYVLFDRYVPRELDELGTDPSAQVYVDVRSVKNPNTKGRNVRYRLALSPGWRAEFSFKWDNTLISRAQMVSILNDAGSLIGLSDGRNLGLGRFVVEIVDIKEARVGGNEASA